MLGDVVEPNQYRFAEAAQRMAEALKAHRAHLPRRSGTLAVRRLQDPLDMTVGSAVRCTDNAGLLIRWLPTDMGAQDFATVEALGQ